MKGIVELTLPKEKFSPIDYFLEKADQLEEVVGIKLTDSSYNRMKQDPYIHQDANESDESEKWIGEEITIEDKYYSPLTYFLSKQEDGSAFVKKIEYEEKVFIFESKEFNVVIDY